MTSTALKRQEENIVKILKNLLNRQKNKETIRYLSSDESSGSSITSKNKKQPKVIEDDSEDDSICACTTNSHECGGVFQCPICETSKDFDEDGVFDHIFGTHEVDIYDPNYNFKEARIAYRQNPQKFLSQTEEKGKPRYLPSDGSSSPSGQKKQEILT